MLKRMVGVAVMALVCGGLVFADEIRGVINKVDGGKITFTPLKKGEKGEAQTLPAAENIKVVSAKFNKDTKKLEAGDPIEGGLKNEMFSKIGEKGMFATIVTEGGKVTEIRVMKGRPGKDKKTDK